MGWIGCVRCEKIKRLRGTNFGTSSARFARVSKGNQTVPNAPKYYETHQNVSLGSNGVDRVRSMRKNQATSWHELWHKFGPFCTSFERQPHSPECTQIVRNAPKRQFRVQWGGSDAFVAKKSEATSWHELLH